MMNNTKSSARRGLLAACCLLLALLLFAAVSFLPGKAHAATVVDSGTCGAEGDGKNLTWTIDSDGLLVISGTGLMCDNSPWWNSKYGGNNYPKKVIIDNGVTSIGDFAFSNRSKLTSVSIPNSVTSIGRYTFSECWELKNVMIPNSVTSIGDSAFAKCKSLTSVSIPDSVTSIGRDVFYGCNNLTSVTIPNYITSIETCMFCGCTALTTVTIPKNATSIGIDAFSGCSSLTSVTIPKTVTSIMNSAFNACSGLKDVYYGGSESDWNRIEIGAWNSYLTNATIHYNNSGPAKNTYTVTYNANGGTGAPASQQKTQGVDLRLRTNIPTKTCKITYNANGGTVSPVSKTVSATFVNWNTKKDGSGISCGTNATYKSDSSLTLYAQWKNPAIGTLATPVREGYTFDGWYTAASGGNRITVSTTITESITIYAHWSECSHKWYFNSENTRLACSNCAEFYDLSPKLGFKYGRDNFGFEHKDINNYDISDLGKQYMDRKLKLDYCFAGSLNAIRNSSSWGGSCYGIACMDASFMTTLPTQYYGADCVNRLSLSYSDKLKDSINIMMYSQLSILTFGNNIGHLFEDKNKIAVNAAKNLTSTSFVPVVSVSGEGIAHSLAIIGILPDDYDEKYYVIVVYDCNELREPRFIIVSKDYKETYMGKFDFDNSNGPIRMETIKDIFGKRKAYKVKITSIKTGQMTSIEYWAPGLSTCFDYLTNSNTTKKKSVFRKKTEEEYDSLAHNYDMFMFAADDSISINGSGGSHFTYKNNEVLDSNIENIYCEFIADFGVTKVLIPHKDETYEIESQTRYYASLNSRGSISAAYCEKGGKAVFTCDGTASVDTSDTKSYYELTAFKYNLIGDSDVLSVATNGISSSTRIDYSGSEPIIRSDNWEKTGIQIQHDNKKITTEKLQVKVTQNTDSITLYESSTDSNKIMVRTATCLPGDVSGDGEVTAEDARLALRAAVGLETYAAGSVEFLAADASHDGEITSEDARLILRAAVGLETLN